MIFHDFPWYFPLMMSDVNFFFFLNLTILLWYALAIGGPETFSWNLLSDLFMTENEFWYIIQCLLVAGFRIWTYLVFYKQKAPNRTPEQKQTVMSSWFVQLGLTPEWGVVNTA